MKDLMGMMGKVKEMQAKMEQVQNDIAAMSIEGRAGGGLVTVVLDGKGQMKSLKIDPSLFKEDDVEILEDLIVAAHKDAKDKGEAQAAEKMSALTAGLPLPPGMKFPF
jgi:DNA-binding YbaB/EbfC family protein